MFFVLDFLIFTYKYGNSYLKCNLKFIIFIIKVNILEPLYLIQKTIKIILT